MANDAPPSYDAVTTSILQKAKAGVNVAAVVPNLTPEELAKINNAEPPPAYTDDEKAKVHEAVAKILAEDEKMIEILKEAAKTGVEACKKNDEIFTSLLNRLLKVDMENIKDQKDAFAPRLKELREKYRTIIENSRKLAAQIAVYGTNFDEVVIAMCADTTLTTEQRREAIGKAVTEAKSFETQSKKIVDDLNGAKDDFNALAVSFANWAQTQSANIDKDIARVQGELKDLSDRLVHLRNILIGFGVGAGVGIALVIGGCFAGPFAPLCWAAGALITIGFGVGLVATGIQFAACQTEIDKKNAELARLTQNKKGIETARADLVNAAAVHAVDFSHHIGSITTVWMAAQSDAVSIQSWLEKGAATADTPRYMAIQLEHGIALYSKMSQYLSAYAMGLDASGIAKPVVLDNSGTA